MPEENEDRYKTYLKAEEDWGMDDFPDMPEADAHAHAHAQNGFDAWMNGGSVAGRAAAMQRYYERMSTQLATFARVQAKMARLKSQMNVPISQDANSGGERDLQVTAMQNQIRSMRMKAKSMVAGLLRIVASRGATPPQYEVLMQILKTPDAQMSVDVMINNVVQFMDSYCNSLAE